MQCYNLSFGGRVWFCALRPVRGRADPFDYAIDPDRCRAEICENFRVIS